MYTRERLQPESSRRKAQEGKQGRKNSGQKERAAIHLADEPGDSVGDHPRALYALCPLIEIIAGSREIRPFGVPYHLLTCH